MKTTILTILISAALIAALSAQSSIDIFEVQKPAGERCVTWSNGTVVPGDGFDYSTSIWNNTAVSGWWSGVTTGYLNLDWGHMASVSVMPDALIDGFLFKYGTNNVDPAGESINCYYFDQCTGWGNLGIQAAGFGFGGLPNCYGLPSLPPGYGWIWSVTVDLESSGYEFLLNNDSGFGQAFSMPAPSLMGATGLVIGLSGGFGGNGYTGTADAFDIYYPNGAYNGTWYFGGYPYWATWSGELYGHAGCRNMEFYGVGAQGNNLHLYTTGVYPDETARFFLAANGMSAQGWLLASVSSSNQYYPTYGITRLVGGLAPGFPKLMDAAFIGDFWTTAINIPQQYSGLEAYFQGIVGGPIPVQGASPGLKGILLKPIAIDEDFEKIDIGQKPPDWAQSPGGTWSVQKESGVDNKVYELECGEEYSNSWFSSYTTYKDFIFEAAMRQTDGHSASTYGINFRGNYAVRINAQTGLVELVKYGNYNPNPKPLIDDEFPDHFNKGIGNWNSVRVTVTTNPSGHPKIKVDLYDDTLEEWLPAFKKPNEVYVDDDDPHKEGKVGLFGNGKITWPGGEKAKFEFDDVKLTPLD